MLAAWIGMFFGSINLTQTLTIIALILTITFTALQIYKLWREIKKERAAEAFAKSLQHTEPTPL